MSNSNWPSFGALKEPSSFNAKVEPKLCSYCGEVHLGPDCPVPEKYWKKSDLVKAFLEGLAKQK